MSVILGIYGFKEPELARRLKALEASAVPWKVQGQDLDLQIHVDDQGGEKAWEKAAAWAESAIRALGEQIYSVDGRSLEAVVLDQLKARELRLALAESCTGGGLGARLASVPGASKAFVGGFITYSDELKQSLLEVPPFVLKKAGAVSKDTALAMAVGLARKIETDYSVAITGLAGPDGGSKDKPVGTVHIALAGPNGIRHQEHHFEGTTRTEVQDRSVRAALWLLYADLLGLDA